MSITTLDGLIAAIKRKVIYQKTAVRTSVSNIPFSVFDLAGQPGAGNLAVGNSGAGIVPTDTATGYALLAPSVATLYVNIVQTRSSVSGWIDLYDCLFSAGAYSFNAAVTLSGQPSYAARVPNGDYTGTELWLETVTAFTGNQSVAIAYLDQGGASGTTGTVATGVAPTVGRMFQMPLAAGDSGVSRVDSVTSTVSTVGTFNVHVLRHLYGARINQNGVGVVDGLLTTGLPWIYDTSALRIVVTPDATSTGLPSLRLGLVDG